MSIPVILSESQRSDHPLTSKTYNPWTSESKISTPPIVKLGSIALTALRATSSYLLN